MKIPHCKLPHGHKRIYYMALIGTKNKVIIDLYAIQCVSIEFRNLNLLVQVNVYQIILYRSQRLKF